MIPAGYMYKLVERETSWLEPAPIRAICSVSDCVSGRHELFEPALFPLNDAKLADSPGVYARVAAEEGQELDLEGYTLFYYEMYESEYDDTLQDWRDIPSEAFPGLDETPRRSMLLGYDVAVFQENIWSIGCSPLSCNLLAKEISVNEYCLFDSLSQAVAALDNRQFDRCEPGPYRIFSVFEVLDDGTVDASDGV